MFKINLPAIKKANKKHVMVTSFEVLFSFCCIECVDRMELMNEKFLKLGSYSLVEADGSLRTVIYTADPVNGEDRSIL